MYKGFVIFFCLNSILGELELISMAVLTRHGHRYSYSDKIPKNKITQLSSVGQRQLYLLGKHLRKKYSYFFSQEFKENENDAWASGHNRTIMSNQALLQGIYDFGSIKEEIEPELKDKTYPQWQNFNLPQDLPKTPLPQGMAPFGINSLQYKKNYFLEGWFILQCPKMRQYNTINEEYKTQTLKLVTPEFLDDFKKRGVDYREIIGENTQDIDNIFKLIDYSLSQAWFGQLPEMDMEFMKRLNLVVGMIYQTLYYSSKEMMKYQNTYVFRKIKNFIENSKKRNNKEIQQSVEKFFSFNLHDSNLLGFLTTFGFSNYECIHEIYTQGKTEKQCYGNPPYASSLIFELLKDTMTDEYKIKILFNDQVLPMCDSDGLCSYDEFIKFLENNSMEGDINMLANKYCRDIAYYTTSKDYFWHVMIFINGIGIAIFGFLIYNLKKKVIQSKQNQEVELVQ